MEQMIIRHKVKDFYRWKKYFEASDVFRRMYGETGYKIFRNAENPNDISIVFEWKDSKKAIKYAESEELKSAMSLAGVLEPPFLYLSDEQFD